MCLQQISQTNHLKQLFATLENNTIETTTHVINKIRFLNFLWPEFIIP